VAVIWAIVPRNLRANINDMAPVSIATAVVGSGTAEVVSPAAPLAYD
jgi:hypothetical protein